MCYEHDKKEGCTSCEQHGEPVISAIHDIKIPEDFIGSTIVDFGSLGINYSGGGLLIIYKTREGEFKNAKFEVSEMGVWAV